MFKGTVIVEYIDGFDIVMGFDEPVIDPIETRKVVDKLIFKTDEYKAIIDKQAEMEISRKAGNTACIAAGTAEQKGDKTEAATQFEIYKNQSEIFNATMKELAGLQPALKIIHRKLFLENAIYFHPKGTEFIRDIKSVKELKDKMQSLKPGEVLTLDNKIVVDCRGIHCWKKEAGEWKEIIINKMGSDIPTGAKLVSELSEDEQLEIYIQVKKEKISKLSFEDKEKHKEDEILIAAASAAGMRSQLEIQGDNEALGKSKADYNKKVAEINDMYG